MLNIFDPRPNDVKSFTYQGKTFVLPDTEYNWQTWNCIHLADYIREEFGLSRSPDFSYLWKEKYPTEKDAPENLIVDLMSDYCELTTELEDFSLCVINFSNAGNLATVLNGYVIFMGKDKACLLPIERITKYLTGWWKFV